MKTDRLIKKMLLALFFMINGILCLIALWFVGMKYMEWIENSDIFSVKNIHVVGNDLLSQKDILLLSDIEETQSIWDVDLMATQERLKNHAFIEYVHLERRFPNTICIRVIEKQPVALLNCDGTFYCIDPEAIVLPSRPGKLYNLPVISGDFKGGVSVGHKARGKRVEQGLSFLLILQTIRPQLYAHISEIVLGKKEGLLIYTTKSGIPVWMGEDAYGEKLFYLDAILERLNKDREMDSVRYIDLRFEGQVVVGMRV